MSWPALPGFDSFTGWSPSPDYQASDISADSGMSFDGSWTVIDGAGIRSMNFTAGSAGWAIKVDGSAEFNDVTVRGLLIGSTSGNYTTYFGSPYGWWIENDSTSAIAVSITPDSSGNIRMTGDATANEVDFIDFPSGLYIGPSAGAVPQMTGLVIEHSGTLSASDTSILVRGDVFGTPKTLFTIDGDGTVKVSGAKGSTIGGTTFGNGWFQLGTSSGGISMDSNEIMAFGATLYLRTNNAGGVQLGIGGNVALRVADDGSARGRTYFQGFDSAGINEWYTSQDGGSNTRLAIASFNSLNIYADDGGSEMMAFTRNVDGSTGANGTIKSAAINNNTTASAANVVISSGTAYLFRSTSSIRYKSHVEDAPWLATAPLRPVQFWSNTDEKWQIGFIAEDIAAAVPGAAEVGDDGQVENYDIRSVVAVLAAKVNRLERLLSV